MRVCLCYRGYTRILALLKEVLPDDEIVECGPEEVAKAAADSDVLIPTISNIPLEALAKPKLKLVQQYGVGVEIVDITAASASGVLVANVPSAGTGNAESVAELAIGHLIMLGRRIPEVFRRFENRLISSPMGACLWNSTITIVGYGEIGQEIARRLAGFGVRVVAVSRNGPGGRHRDSSIPIALHVGRDRLEDAVAEADFVVVAAPASADNVGLINESVFRRMKRGAYIVNIARGSLIDYDALREALKEGQVAGAGLDVFWYEPFDPKDPLLEYNVVATPHIGGSTQQSLHGIAQRVGANVDRIRQGILPVGCFNPEIGTGRLSEIT